VTGDVVHVDPEVASLLREVAGQKASLLFAKPRWPDTRQYIRPSATGLTAPERELVVRHREYLAYLLRRAMWEAQLRNENLRPLVQAYYPGNREEPPVGRQELRRIAPTLASPETQNALALLWRTLLPPERQLRRSEYVTLAYHATRLEPSACSRTYLGAAVSRSGDQESALRIYEDILRATTPHIVRYSAALNSAHCHFSKRRYLQSLAIVRPLTEWPDTTPLAASYRFLYAYLVDDTNEIRSADSILRGLDASLVADLLRATLARHPPTIKKPKRPPAFLCTASLQLIAAATGESMCSVAPMSWGGIKSLRSSDVPSPPKAILRNGSELARRP